MSTILVNYEKPEIRIAEVDNGHLSNFGREHLLGELGNIYVGTVANVLSGMEASFIDIGLRKNGLLHSRDVHFGTNKTEKHSVSLRSGQPLLVQVARPSVGQKGPKLTTRISLPGRLIVLVFSSDTVGVSRRIDSESERRRLRNISEKLRPLDCGIILRTEAEGATFEEIASDLQNLIKQLDNIKEQAGYAKKPVCLYKELGILGKLIRDRLSNNTEKIYIDDVTQWAECLKLAEFFAPQLAPRITLYSGKRPLFEAFNVEKEYSKIFNNVVSLPHGGSLVIEETEALTAIDVNTSRFVGKDRIEETILQTNLDAVKIAALQIRLRDIAGVIAIDFIDMERTKDRVQVLNALESALKQDRRKTHIVQLSPSGLVEVTRRREGLSFTASVTDSCSFCHGTGRVKSPLIMGVEIRRRLRALSKDNEVTINVMAHPEVAAMTLGAQCELIQELESDTKGTYFVRVDENMHPESMQIEQIPTSVSNSEIYKPERLTLSVHTPLFPKENPEYVAGPNYLVKLPSNIPLIENDAGVRMREIVVLEVIEIGRWYATARIVRGLSEENSSSDALLR